MSFSGKYELVWHDGSGTPRRIEISPSGVAIGRSDDCEIPLSHDPSVSRRHAELKFLEGRLLARDLGSRNGIKINGVRQDEGFLQPGDRLKVGSQVFELAEQDLGTLTQSVVTMARSALFQQSLVSDNEGTPLATLFKASMLLGEVFDLDELLRELLQLVFESLPPAKRSYILTVSDECVTPRLRASHSAEGEDASAPISQTLVSHVLQKREAVLVHDAQDDDRFDNAASIYENEIHSAMCAPLFGRDAVVGVIYVDSGRSVSPFDNAHLELLSAIGRIAGVAVDNATLHTQIVRSERLTAIGEATAGLGHCIKNILTGMRASADMISMGEEQEDWGQVHVGWPILQRSITRIEMLMLNMLTYSRGGSGHREACDFVSICLDVVETLQAQADKKKIKLELKHDSNARMNADGRELHRLVMNLVTNALDACEDDGGTVQLIFTADQSAVRLEIKDDGVGIAHRDMPRLFEAFFTTKGSRGTGLGLACSQKIAESHGGRIRFQSEEGEGTTVIVELPRDGIPAEKVTAFTTPRISR